MQLHRMRHALLQLIDPLPLSDAMQKDKKRRSRPVELLRAVYSAAMLFCIPGLIITFISPTFIIKLDRINQERVDATVTRQLLFLIPAFKETAVDIRDMKSKTMHGKAIREGSRTTGRIVGNAEDEGVLQLNSRSGAPVSLSVSPVNLDDIEEEISSFINESKEPSQHLWVTSNWKFGVLLPGAILLFSLIVFIMAVRSILTGKTLE